MAKPDPESPALTEFVDGGGVRSRESERSVETRSQEQGRSRRRWDDHRPNRQGLPARALAKHSVSTAEGNYLPLPVKRVEIPKPDGGVRKLGVPCVVDRLIQQALLQVLQKRWDPTFSEHSYGFRPGRSAHQAVAQAQRYVAEGYGVVVDLDLEKFFDRVRSRQLDGAGRRAGVR